MVRFLPIFIMLCTFLHGDGMIISFEQTPERAATVPSQSVVENSETLSRSPPRPDDLPLYPNEKPYDLEVDSPCSIKGPNYFRKKPEPLEVVPTEADNRPPLEIDSSREIKRPAFRGRETQEPTSPSYPEEFRDGSHSFDSSDSFFDEDSSHPDRFNNSLRSSMGNYEKTIMHTALVVFGFILFLLLFVWLLRKFNRGKGHATGTEITVLEKKPLSHKSVLYLVKVNNKKFLIAESQLEVKAMRPVNIALEEE